MLHDLNWFLEEKYFSFSYIIARETCSDRNVLLLQQSIMTIKIENINLLNSLWKGGSDDQKTAPSALFLAKRFRSEAKQTAITTRLEVG